jgi:hypothetical protein
MSHTLRRLSLSKAKGTLRRLRLNEVKVNIPSRLCQLLNSVYSFLTQARRLSYII